ncbi:fimbrial protein [Paraburkholderia sp. SOS3]|jgi:major type 1 subunit fimbrin (pilin)|uniref:fimbrial protein n=1 Tax=Paraburkholderia sp. SOS3 TaxID=1926494 RepID=UPI0009F8D224|nr:fimbrial protein [Paraburkholderia sp. SOS3]
MDNGRFPRRSNGWPRLRVVGFVGFVAFRLPLMCATFVSIAGSQQAMAACSWRNGQTTRDYTFNIPSLTVPRDAAVGTILYTPPYQSAIPSSGAYATCSGNTPVVRAVTGGTQFSTNPYTYATNVPGIGVRFFDTDGASFFRYYGAGAQEIYNGDWAFNSMKFGVQVVVTGKPEAGTINGTLFATMSLGTLTVANLRVTTASVTAAACTAAATQTVVLPNVSGSALPSVGATTGSTPFAIRLSGCPKGLKQIQYQLDPPDGAIDAANGTFALSRDSTAKGVALSVTDAAQDAIKLQTPQMVPAYDPQTGGDVPVNLAIRYYRTGPVVPGTVKGTLIYTMFYQ